MYTTSILRAVDGGGSTDEGGVVICLSCQVSYQKCLSGTSTDCCTICYHRSLACVFVPSRQGSQSNLKVLADKSSRSVSLSFGVPSHYFVWSTKLLTHLIVCALQLGACHNRACDKIADVQEPVVFLSLIQGLIHCISNSLDCVCLVA